MLREVAIPREHGGWSLTLEPALLGLIVAPSPGGLALTAAGVVAFVARTPVKLVLVDGWRGRRLPRTELAARVASVEVLLLMGLVTAAVVVTEHQFWWPLVLAAPLILLELWYDMRSRGRHLVPEWAGAVGIGSVASAVALAGGEPDGIAIWLWVVIGARAFASVPFVRTQLRRHRGQPDQRSLSDLAQPLAVGVVLTVWLAGEGTLAGVVAVSVLASFQLTAVRRPAPRAAVVGAEQVGLGLMVVLVTALGT